jgi:hypothetical protein
MSPEEFFMYLIIALVVLIPISARVYRYLTIKRVKKMVREQFQHAPTEAPRESPRASEVSNLPKSS